MAYKDKTQQREYQRLWMQRRRKKYIDLFGGACEFCGNPESLEFDHRDRGDKEDHRIWSWSEVRIQAELQKCQLICRPCHTRKTVEERDYPERKHGTNLMYRLGCSCPLCKVAHAEVNSRYR